MPYPPDPARMPPFGKLLGLGHVAFNVARRLFPFLHGFNTCPRAEVSFRNLPRNLVPGRSDKAAQLTYCSERRSHKQEQVEVPRSSPLYSQPPEGGK